MILHALDHYGRDVFHIHTQHLASLQDQFTVAFCSKPFVLPLLHEALDLHISDSVGAHSGCRLDDPCQFVNGKQTLLHVGDRLHIRTDRITVGKDRSDVFLRYAEFPQRFFCMCQVLLRILLIVIVMQVSDCLPVLFVFSEMIRHGAHGCGNIRRMQDQVLFCHHGSIDLFCLLQC